jgi:adenylate cyclase class 2
VLKELEVEVSDFSTMAKILEAIGFHKAQVYEKWRETFTLEDVMLLIDAMPYGDFLEIEGNREQIQDLVGRLGLKWENRILYNYLQLFDIIKKELNLPFSDVTFQKFQALQVDLSPYLDMFVAG